jgi:hypothetical protein
VKSKEEPVGTIVTMQDKEEAAATAASFKSLGNEAGKRIPDSESLP